MATSSSPPSERARLYSPGDHCAAERARELRGSAAHRGAAVAPYLTLTPTPTPTPTRCRTTTRPSYCCLLLITYYKSIRCPTTTRPSYCCWYCCSSAPAPRSSTAACAGTHYGCAYYGCTYYGAEKLYRRARRFLFQLEQRLTLLGALLGDRADRIAADQLASLPATLVASVSA